MKTMTINELHAKLEAAGCGHAQEVRKHDKGGHGHQGDVYCIPIAKRPECWDIETTDQSRQVAVGHGEGSNHRASGNVRVYWPKSAAEAADQCPLKKFFGGDRDAQMACLGPVVEADEEWTLTHPKHAHHTFPAGTFLITFQLDRRTMRRVQD